MSKKIDIIVVGVLSAALFTGFTAYSYSADKTKEKAQTKLSMQVTTGAQTASVQPLKLAPAGSVTASTVQAPADKQPDNTQPTPDATVTKKKTTKSKAS